MNSEPTIRQTEMLEWFRENGYAEDALRAEAQWKQGKSYSENPIRSIPLHKRRLFYICNGQAIASRRNEP